MGNSRVNEVVLTAVIDETGSKMLIDFKTIETVKFDRESAYLGMGPGSKALRIHKSMNLSLFRIMERCWESSRCNMDYWVAHPDRKGPEK